MSKKNTFLLSLLLTTLSAFAQKLPLTYYLPDISYDKNIPTPEQFLGWQIGEWHVSHDQVVAYMKELDRLSDRISIEEHGRTYERRPLLVLFITHPDNFLRLREIKEQHVKLADPSLSAELNTTQMPSVLYQGYSIHGNEASGTNAAMLMAYYYAAAKGDDIEAMLRNMVVLFDPSFNPDGLHRFSTWVNQHKNKNLTSDNASREYNEVWPGGRTNHYYFDLNRDWLVAQMPESQGRVRLFQEWKPNILTDHHEMGTNSTFFFQPGVPSRVNPNTPKQNQELTAKIGNYHAQALDKIGSLYYTKENFDDFYYGKGSTYPDVQGAIGILFEQASSRGHLQRSSNGLLSFAFTIRNQVTASFSTIKAAQEMRTELLNYQRDFFKLAKEEANKDKVKALIFGDSKDRTKTYDFLKILFRHKIKIYENQTDMTIQGQVFEKGNSFIIPMQQQQYKLIKGMFERPTKFSDSLFYDISAWSLDLAFNMPMAELDKPITVGREILDMEQPRGQIWGARSNYAYVMEWREYRTPHALNALLNENLIVKVATQPFRGTSNGNYHDFDYGSILIPVMNQNRSPEAMHILIENIAQESGVNFFPLETGLTIEGIDAGSPNFQTIKAPKIAIIVGEGTSAHDIGEAWHLLDQRYDMAVSAIEADDLARINLSNYNFIYLSDGNYNTMLDIGKAKLREWIAAGNTLFAAGGDVLRWLKENNIYQFKFVTKLDKKPAQPQRKPYSSIENDMGAHLMGGAIFDTKIDVSHPLCYGFSQSYLPVFQADTTILALGKNPYATPLQFTKTPLMAGYVHTSLQEVMREQTALGVYGVGNGRIIATTINPNFRAFWYGTNKIFANAIFFANLISRNTTEKRE
jgi:hypothetical protein